MSQGEAEGFIYEATGPRFDETFKFHSIKKEDRIKIGRNIYFSNKDREERIQFHIRLKTLMPNSAACCSLDLTRNPLEGSTFYKKNNKEKNPKQHHLSASSCWELFAGGAYQHRWD